MARTSTGYLDSAGEGSTVGSIGQGSIWASLDGRRTVLELKDFLRAYSREDGMKILSHICKSFEIGEAARHDVGHICRP